MFLPLTLLCFRRSVSGGTNNAKKVFCTFKVSYHYENLTKQQKAHKKCEKNILKFIDYATYNASLM